MNKFNLPRRNIQKERRQKRTERRKQKASTAAVKASSVDVPCKSSALSLNVSTNGHSGYLSGKNRSKLQKRWRRAQKEALQSGLVTMHDIEMMAADEEGGTDEGSVQPSLPKSKKKFSMKKRAKLRSKSSSSKEQVSEPVVISNAGADGEDAMMQ